MLNESGFFFKLLLLWLNGTKMKRCFDWSNDGFIVLIKPEVHIGSVH